VSCRLADTLWYLFLLVVGGLVSGGPSVVEFLEAGQSQERIGISAIGNNVRGPANPADRADGKAAAHRHPRSATGRRPVGYEILFQAT